MVERGWGARDHARHDLELIARAAAGDGSAADSRAAAELREACSACRTLDADLRSIAAAARALRGSAVPAAPRDFRLGPADAARLRRRGFAGLLGPRGPAAGGAMGRFGSGLVAIGLVGLVFGSGLVGPLGGLGAGGGQPAAAPAYSAGTPAASAAGGGVATEKDNATEGLVLAPAQTGTALAPAPYVGATQTDRAGSAAGSGYDQGSSGARDESSPVGPANPVVFVSLSALAVGLGLILAGRNGRRARR